MALKITGRDLLKISRLVDKLDLKIENAAAPAEEVGASLIMQIVRKLGTAEDEVADLLTIFTGGTKEEALEVDLLDLYETKIKPNIKQLAPFLQSVTKAATRK